MASKDAGEVKYIYLRCVGGEAPGGAVLAPKVGSLGLSPKVIGEQIAKATTHLKGLRTTVCLTVLNRVVEVSIVPAASTLVISALNEPPRDRKKEKNIKHNGNLTFEKIIEIARQMRHKSMARTFIGTVKEILGTAFSIGCTIDGESPKEITEKVDSGELEVPEE